VTRGFAANSKTSPSQKVMRKGQAIIRNAIAQPSEKPVAEGTFEPAAAYYFWLGSYVNFGSRNTQRWVMIRTKIGGAAGFGAMTIIAALGLAAAVSAPTPAEARVFVGFGFGFPIGFPFFYPPYPYYPPPVYYTSLPYYPAAASYAAPGTPSQPLAGYASSGPAGSPSITYTPRRGRTTAQGQYCREYRTTGRAGNRATERYGTACRDASGQSNGGS